MPATSAGMTTQPVALDTLGFSDAQAHGAQAKLAAALTSPLL
jgi:hypothetical protein